MEDMVERVARAIDASGSLGVSLAFTEPQAIDTDTIRRARVSDTERAMKAARAAIEAMREPVGYMPHAGGMAMAGKDHGSMQTPIDVWQAMIDAALNNQDGR